MENFSTLRRALVPWTTNIVTLAVLVYATWWSSGHRPPENMLGPNRLATASPVLKAALPLTAATAKPVPAAQVSVLAPMAWPSGAAAAEPGGLQTVGFNPELAQ